MPKLARAKSVLKRRLRRCSKKWSVRYITGALHQCRTPESTTMRYINMSPASSESDFFDLISHCSTISLPESAHEIVLFHSDQPEGLSFMESIGLDILSSPTKSSRGGSSKLYHELQTEIAKKNQDLSSLQQEIWRLESSQGSQEVQNCVLDDAVADLKNSMNRVKADLALLQEHEAASVHTLGNVLELKKREIDVDFGTKLTKIKEELTEEIVASVSEKRKKDLAQKELLEAAISKLHDQIMSQPSDFSQSLAAFQQSHEQTLNVLREGGDAALAEIKQMINELEGSVSQKRQKRAALKELVSQDLKRSASQLDTTVIALQKKQALKEAQKQSLEEKLATLKNKIDHLSTSKEDISNSIQKYEQERQEFLESYNALETERRVLHNKLQELKGNFRVFCRVRPSLEPGHDLIPMQIMSHEELSAEGKQILELRTKSSSYDYGQPQTKSLVARNGTNLGSSNLRFEFDRIFAPESTNSEVFLEISQLVQSSLDGFNVCVFAYGQTGSGKTWTMSHAEDGMIPLSITKIFSDIHELRAQGWEYTIDGQFVEIYNEQILDLLARGKPNAKLEVKHDDGARKTSIANCMTVRLRSKEHAIEVLEAATSKRSTASTMMNSRSSRSHSVFLLSIQGRHKETGAACEGSLNLIDLAGSERLNSSQAKGERLKETQAINKSLSCLGDVIHNLGQQQNQASDVNATHVPYRNSKLTYLLKHSLGGDSKTLMFVNVSSHAENTNETINSLRFAKKVNSTKLR